MAIAQTIKQAAADHIQGAYGTAIDPDSIAVQQTRPEFEGDFTIVVFPLTRISKLSPQATAEALGGALNALPEARDYNIVKGFLNLRLTDAFWTSTLDETEPAKAAQPKRLMVEYSSPNTNKPLHLGHVRNNLLGFAVGNILSAVGHTVTLANLVNDRGVHICKSMIAWQRWGRGETPESSGLKGDHLVGKYYVEYSKHLKEQLADLKAQGVGEVEAARIAPLAQEAQAMLLKWEQGDPETRELWGRMNGWVYEGFAKSYESLGVKFDLYQYESETYLLGKEIVQEGLETGAFTTRADNSVSIDLTAEGLDEKTLQRGDGTSIYITQDLGTAQERFEKFDLDGIIYVVGNEQEYHFKVLRMIFKALGRPWWNSIQHLSYGMVELPTGKLKSREGKVVDADDLIEEMIATAKETTEELGKSKDFSPFRQKELYRQIGLAALKFFMLRSDPKKKMLYDPKESIDFQGFTGPFIQYTHARIRSLLAKAKEKHLSDTLPYDGELMAEEREVLILLYGYPAKLLEAAAELSPAVLLQHIYDLAKAYNSFYHACPVNSEPDPNRRAFRLRLCTRLADTLKAGTALCGIEMPERM